MCIPLHAPAGKSVAVWLCVTLEYFPLLPSDTPGAYYIEMITIADDGQCRARTWQWFKDRRPWKRTLCDEWRIK